MHNILVQSNDIPCRKMWRLELDQVVTKSVLWKIPMMTLILLMHMKNKIEKMVSNKNSLEIKIKTQSLKKN